MWDGGSVWIGRQTGLVQTHAHYAIQITVALSGEFSIRGANERDWHRSVAAIVMSDHRHQFDGCGSTVANIFVEPESTRGRMLRKRLEHRALLDRALPCPPAVEALRDAFESRAADAVIIRATHALIQDLAGEGDALEAVDARIAAAMEWIRTRLHDDITLEHAAAVAHLSPSRFRHLFVAQTGISFRAYLRWARVQWAVAAAFRGKTWTEAALEAGFADSAHLSRTCRRMFGLSPAMLVPE
jgi:AraC family transcriptional regulator